MAEVSLTYAQIEKLYQRAAELDTNNSGFLSRQEAERGRIALPSDFDSGDADPYKIAAYIYHYTPQINLMGANLPGDEFEVPVYRLPDEIIEEKLEQFDTAEYKLYPHNGIYVLGQSYVRYAVCKKLLQERIGVSEMLLGLGRINEAEEMFEQAESNLEYLRSRTPNSPYYLESILAFAEAHGRRGEPRQAIKYATEALSLLDNTEEFFDPLARTGPLTEENLAGYRARAHVLLAEISLTAPHHIPNRTDYFALTQENLESIFDFHLWTRYKMARWETAAEDASTDLESIFGGKEAFLSDLRTNADPEYFGDIAEGAGAARMYDRALVEFGLDEGWAGATKIFSTPSLDVDWVLKAALLLAESYRNRGEAENALLICEQILLYQEIHNKPYHLGKALYLKGKILMAQEGQGATGLQLVKEALEISAQGAPSRRRHNVEEVFALGEMTYEGTPRLNAEAVKEHISLSTIDTALRSIIAKKPVQGQLAPFFGEPSEFWNHAILLLSVYTQKAIEAEDRDKMATSLKIAERFQATVRNLHNRKSRPSNYSRALLDLTQAEIYSQAEGENRAFYQKGIQLARQSIKKMQNLPVPDYFSIIKGLIVLGGLYEKSGQMDKALACYRGVSGKGIRYKDATLTIRAPQQKMLASLHNSQRRGYVSAEQVTEAWEGINLFLVPSAQLKAAEALLSLDRPEDAKTYLARAKRGLDAAKEKSPHLAALYVLLNATATARTPGISEADITREIATLGQMVSDLQPDSYLAARSYVVQGELYLAIKDDIRAEETFKKIPPKYLWLYAQETVKRVDVLAADLAERVTFSTSAGEVFVALDDLTEAVEILEQSGKGDDYFAHFATLVQGKLLLVLLDYHREQDQPINRDIIISKLMESVNPDKIALDRSANDELIFMTAYNLFCGVPGSLGRLTDLAIVSRGMVLVQNPDAFDPLFVESEIAELDVLIDTLRDLPDPDPYLFALALVTKGELLLQKADRTIDLAQAKKELKLAQKWFDDILAEDSLERIVIENYPTLLAKATVLRASLMTRGDLAASLEIWEIDAEVERLIPACSQFVPGTYLGTLADITLAELNIAQASKTQDPGALQEAKALLENVPSEYGYLYAKSRLLRGSILARQADSIDKQIIETAIQQIRAAANHFELNSYYDILADLTLGELNLALADKTDNRVYLDRANAAFESVLTLDAYDYIYNKAVVLDAVVAARREEEIDFGALNRSITYFEQKAPQGYILAQAYVTKGELLIQTTDRLENYASASTQLATTKAWFKEIREKAMLKKFNKLYAKATILEIALLIRQPELLKDAQIAVLSAQLTISLPFFKTGSYLHAMASLLQGELQLILANRGLETDANLRTAERFFSHKQLENYPHLHARALIKRVEIGIRKRRKASTLLSLCNQAREKLSAKDVHLNLESAHQKMTLLIMLNRPSHALKLANEVLATLATTQQLRTEQKTFFTLYAKLRKAEAYIQLSARQAQDALDLLKEIEKAICAPLPPYIYAKLKDIPAILDGTVGDGPQDSIKILDVAAQVLRSNEHYGLAAKLDQARSAAKKREYEETRRLTNEVLTELGPLDISQAFEESMRLLGWDLHSFRSELYHQTAIAYSIQGRRQADLTYEYANSACVEGKESKSSYDREERIKILFKLLKEPKTPCACTPEK